MTVLVVDDDPVIVKLLQVNFEMEDYRVLTAGDGVSGLTAAGAHRPDVVVLDVMMPGMDGLEVSRRMREDEATRDIPVLLLSAKAQGSDIAAGLEVADGYMTKPFEPLELLDRVVELVDAARAGDLRRAAPPVGP
jgi:two-component system alkaline phosphatase synthesis response regulator PhoP